jgi:hypothetical protein
MQQCIDLDNKFRNNTRDIITIENEPLLNHAK